MTELSPEARALLDATRHADGLSPASRARIRAALDAKLHPAPPPGAASARWLPGLGGAAVIVAAGIVAVTSSRTPPPAPAAVSAHVSPTPPPRPPSLAPPRVPAPMAPAPSLAPPRAPRDVARRHRARTSPPLAAPAPALVPAPAPSSVTEPDMEGEVRLLSVSQRALDEHRTAEALRVLDAYDAAHPRGMMREEAAAQRVLALCGRGRGDEARALAARITRESPGSPAALRVRGVCEAAP